MSTLKIRTRSGKTIIPPVGAVAAIVAEFVEDRSDSMTDYYATTCTRTVLIGWRYTARESFAALRKAAGAYHATKHLGPGCDVYTVSVALDNDARGNDCCYWKGMTSPWDRDREQTFTTRREAEAFMAAQDAPGPILVDGQTVGRSWALGVKKVEHRDNYSMGAGNYLKAGTRYSSGVVVRSCVWSVEVDAVALHVAPTLGVPSLIERREQDVRAGRLLSLVPTVGVQ